MSTLPPAKDTTHAERVAFQQGYMVGVSATLGVIRRWIATHEPDLTSLPNTDPHARGFIRFAVSKVAAASERVFIEANKQEDPGWCSRQERQQRPLSLIRGAGEGGQP